MLLNSAGVWFGAAVFVIFCLLFPKAYWGNREWYLVALVVLIGFLVALGACCGVLDTFITGIRHYGFLTGTSLAFVELGTSFTLFSLIVFWGSKMFFVSLLSLGLLVFARFWPGKN